MLRTARRPFHSVLATPILTACLVAAAGLAPAFAEAFFLPTGDEVHNTGAQIQRPQLYQQLVRDGWRRTDIDRDDDEIEAEYRRDRQKFELELEREARNRYVLDIDFD